MAGPFDINGLGANYFNTLQPAIQPSNAYAQYAPAFTSSATSISASLTQLCNLDVPAGKTRVILAATLTGLETTSNTLDVEIEVDGVTVISMSSTYLNSIAYLVGNANGASPPSNAIMAIQANRNLKIRARKPSSTAAILTLWYIDRA